MSASTTVVMVAPAGQLGTIYARSGQVYTPNGYGVVNVQAQDVPDLLAAGYTAIGTDTPPSSKCGFVDDFLGDALNGDLYAVAKGSDGAAVDFAIAAAVNGTIAATTGAGAGASMAANGVQIVGALNWQAGQGGLVAEARVKMDLITTVALFFGFGDQVAALEMPFTISGTTLTSNVTDGCGFLFDTAATLDNWKLVGVKQDVDTTVQDIGIPPVADTFETLRIELSNAGAASFFRNGVQVGSTMADAVRTAISLTPYLGGFSRAAASRIFTADYLLTQQNR